jgi:putative cell wall-binding protein
MSFQASDARPPAPPGRARPTTRRLGRWLRGGMVGFLVGLLLAWAGGLAFAQGSGGSSGDYGTSTQTATVTRVYGTTRQDTALAIAQLAFPNGVPSQTAIVTAGNNAHLVDTLLADPLAKALDVPIFLAQNAQVPGNALAQALQTFQVTHLILVGATNNPNFISQLPSGSTVAATYGDTNPYYTAAQVANALAAATGKSSFSQVFLASGQASHWVDALSASPAAAMEGAPILLAPDPRQGVIQIPAAEQAWVQQAQTIYQLGTEAFGVIPNVSASSVPLGGLTRFGTVLAIDRYFFPHPATVFIANGQDAHLVDALTAAPLAATDQAPILLANGGLFTPSGQAYLAEVQQSATAYVIIGGPGSIPSQATQTLEQKQHARKLRDHVWGPRGPEQEQETEGYGPPGPPLVPPMPPQLPPGPPTTPVSSVYGYPPGPIPPGGPPPWAGPGAGWGEGEGVGYGYQPAPGPGGPPPWLGIPTAPWSGYGPGFGIPDQGGPPPWAPSHHHDD